MSLEMVTGSEITKHRNKRKKKYTKRQTEPQEHPSRRGLSWSEYQDLEVATNDYKDKLKQYKSKYRAFANFENDHLSSQENEWHRGISTKESVYNSTGLPLDLDDSPTEFGLDSLEDMTKMYMEYGDSDLRCRYVRDRAGYKELLQERYPPRREDDESVAEDIYRKVAMMKTDNVPVERDRRSELVVPYARYSQRCRQNEAREMVEIAVEPEVAHHQHHHHQQQHLQQQRNRADNNNCLRTGWTACYSNHSCYRLCAGLLAGMIFFSIFVMVNTCCINA